MKSFQEFISEESFKVGDEVIVDDPTDRGVRTSKINGKKGVIVDVENVSGLGLLYYVKFPGRKGELGLKARNFKKA